jgi:hypothetical protein
MMNQKRVYKEMVVSSVCFEKVRKTTEIMSPDTGFMGNATR